MSDVIIPPWVLPESPETLRWIDDATVSFAPAFGRGMTQRGSFADPRWGLRRKYRGLRSDQKAAILYGLNESRGQLNKYLVTPHTPMRGAFPTSELFANGTFGSGTTGWTSGAETAISVSDRIARAVRLTGAANSVAIQPSASVTVTQYAAYAVRYFISSGRGGYPTGFSIYDTVTSARISSTLTTYGMLTGSTVVNGTTINPGLLDETVSGLLAGDYVSVLYASLARCALADNGGNLLWRSETLSDAAWAKTNATITDNSATAPDGAVTADDLVENNTNASHQVLQTVTVGSAVADYSVSVCFLASGRNFAEIIMREGTGSTDLSQYFNLSTGAVGASGTTGANWANRRASITTLGGGWYKCTLTGRKTNAATSLLIVLRSASADGTDSYLGTSASAIRIWRATLAQSSVATRLVSSAGATIPPSAQAGGGIHLKALPASTSGLLEIGDWVEIAGQLKQVTARLNSDAGGLGYLQFRPALGDSPADNDPVIINQPFGRFIYGGGQKEMENLFGIYGDIEMNLEEVYS